MDDAIANEVGKVLYVKKLMQFVKVIAVAMEPLIMNPKDVLVILVTTASTAARVRR